MSASASQRRRRRCGGRSPVNSTRVAEAARRRERGDPREIALARMPADDAPAHVGQQRQRLDQHVDALPRIEVPGVGDDRPAGARARPGERRARRSSRVAVGDDGDGAARPEPVGELLGVRGGHRHVAVGALPRRAARAARAAPASPPTPRRRGACSVGISADDHRRVAVRLVDQRRTPRPAAAAPAAPRRRGRA